jgi:hypothetical protein
MPDKNWTNFQKIGGMEPIRPGSFWGATLAGDWLLLLGVPSADFLKIH